MTSSPLRLIAALGALGFAFVLGLLIGSGPLASTSNRSGRSVVGVPQLSAEADPELAGLEPQIEDAVHRWAVKSRETEESIRESYRPRAMFIPTRNQGQGMLCIELGLKPGDLGGSPVYCYQADFFKPDDTMKLVAEYSDVE